MITFAFIDARGLPTGGGKHPRTLPEGAVELPSPWDTTDLPRLRFRDGHWEVRDDLVPDPAPTPEEVKVQRAAELARARAQATDRINARVGEVRRRIYTDIPGQDALYLEKRAEAKAYVAAAREGGEPSSLADYPLLENETGVTAPEPWQLAQLWLNRSVQFKRVGAATERLRMRALIATATAPDLATLETIEAQFTEALSGLPL